MRLREDIGLLLRWLRESALGQLKHVRLLWHRERGVPASAWRTDTEQSPLGVVEDLAPHLLDILASIVREQNWKHMRLTSSFLRCAYGESSQSASWFGQTSPIHYQVPDQAWMQFQSESESKTATAEVEVRWANEGRGDWCSFELEGEKGHATFAGLIGFSTNRRHDQQVCSLQLHGQPPLQQYFSSGHELQTQAFNNLIKTFLQFVRGNGTPLASWSEIAQTARWMEDLRDANRDWCARRFASQHHDASSTHVSDLTFDLLEAT